MASADTNIHVKKNRTSSAINEWMLANPWLWLVAGFALTLWSWLWTLARGDLASDYRVIVLAFGLLLGGVGLWLRWTHRESLYLHQWRAPTALFLGSLFALLGSGVVIIFVMSFFAAFSSTLRSAPLFLVLVSTTPACFVAARHCLNHSANDPVDQDAEQEVGLAFVVAAAICLLGSFTLYADPGTPSDWDTMRMVLRVFTAVALFAAALTLATQGLRRLIVSVLFTLHFCGICTAALSAPPAPWIIQQTWMRFFRPYLEFVYLNNAYHFYAPDPGPASYMWFRIIYEGPTPGEDGKKPLDGMWFKVPQIDDDGRLQHPVALDYQRFLSLTEAAAHPDALPPDLVYNPKTQQWEQHTFYSNRLNSQPTITPQLRKIGEGQVHQIQVPLHSQIPTNQQVFIPNDNSRRLLASYARFVARKFKAHPDPEKSAWTFRSVKVYRVVHHVPTVQWFVNEIPPNDPGLYRPYYVGNYNADGKILEDGDVYRYWLLPIIREDINDRDSRIRDYARLHAGDRQWIRRPKDKKWVELGDE